jgi:hypothetical protein
MPRGEHYSELIFHYYNAIDIISNVTIFIVKYNRLLREDECVSTNLQ